MSDVLKRIAAMRFNPALIVYLTRSGHAACVRLEGHSVLDQLLALHEMAPYAEIYALDIEEDDLDGHAHFTEVRWNWRPTLWASGPIEIFALCRCKPYGPEPHCHCRRFGPEPHWPSAHVPGKAP